MNLKQLIALVIFSIAMGFLEGAVVVYLRELYYPDGFNFPLNPIPDHIAVTELIREISTIVMLFTIGYIAGKDKITRFAGFIICFGIWDIVYYLALKLILDWPASIMDWDILFLIPCPWIGPVLAPCLVSVAMIILGFIIYYKSAKPGVNRILKIDRYLMFTGCGIILWSFLEEYLLFISNTDDGVLWGPGNKKLFEIINTYIPGEYNWWVFIIGYLLVLIGIFRYGISKNPAGRTIKERGW